MKEQRLRHLFDLYVGEQCTPGEEAELMKLLSDRDLAALRDTLIETAYDQLPENFLLSDERANGIFGKIVHEQGPVVHIHRVKRHLPATYRAAAAAVIFLIAAGGYFLFHNNKSARPADTVQNGGFSKTILAPGKSHAIITLSGGQKIGLDSAEKGSLAIQGGVQVLKLADGQIAYKPQTPASKEPMYNTLFNPRGSRVVSLTLTDGTQVWLNAESSLRYPAAFSGKERKVDITGEAYFEVAPDAAKPFWVSSGATTVQVLGTHFNVNAYADEPAVKVTLLEGSVKVGEAVTIRPGEQAMVTKGKISLVRNVDLENIMAWKNGKFDFGARTDLPAIMRQIGRWYDIGVVFAGDIPHQEFGGEMPRSSDLGQVLEILKTSGVKFTIQDKKLIVMP